MTKNCTNCEAFCWWDGDWCCTMKMAILQNSEDGKFHKPLPKKFDANKCSDYKQIDMDNEYAKWEEKFYVDFLIEYYELPYTYNEKDNILKTLGYDYGVGEH